MNEKQLAQKFVDYIHVNLGFKPRLRDVNMGEKLPFYLSRGYDFHAVDIMGHHYVLQVVSSFKHISPAQLRKQWEQVRNQSNDIIPILVAPSIDAYNRKRLIEQKIPFVVPGNQMYLPDLAMDLREYFRRDNEKPKNLTPSAQLCLITLLLEQDRHFQTLADLAHRLAYSKMTMSRAANELIHADLALEEWRGKTRWLKLSAPQAEIWKRAEPVLRDPVQQKKYVLGIHHDKEGFLLAGESALSELSMLNPPRHDCIAVSRNMWKVLQVENIQILPGLDSMAVEVQVWRYDPLITAQGNQVDPLSLFLSLNKAADERMMGALHDMIEDLQW